MDTLPPEPDAPVPSPAELAPAPAPVAAPPRHSALLFVAVLLPLYAFAGGLAQAAQPFLGLVASQAVLLLLPAILVPLGCGYRPRAALRLRAPAPAALALGVAIGLAAFFAAGALMSLASLAFPARWVEGFDLPRKILELPPRQRLGLWIAAATLAPLCEEACFRGWVLTALRTRHGTGRALVISGLLFAVVHLDPVRFAAVLALGTLYAWLAWRAGSLWPAVAAHVTNNALGAALAAAGGDTDPVALRAHPGQVAASAAVMLVLAGSAVRLLAHAYRRATPAPPPPEAALVARDPAAPPSRFRWRRVPRRWRLAFLAGVALLWAMAWRGAATPPGGTRGASGSAPPGTAGAPGDRAAGAAPPPAAGRRAP